MIKVENLKKNFGALQVLDGISFELEKGKVLAVVGPSGTGKSTLLRCLNYLEKPSEGKITIGNISADSKKIQKQEIYRLREKQLWFSKTIIFLKIRQLCKISWNL